MKRASKTCTAKAGFSLVELLVVISIISLLASILIPSVTAAMASARKVKSQAIVNTFEGGLQKWHMDHRQVYPGQKATHWNSAPLQSASGSELLARAMFTDKSDEFPRDAYVPYKGELLVDDADVTQGVSDGLPEPLRPILYFPAKLGNNGKVDGAFFADLGDGKTSWDVNKAHAVTAGETASDVEARFKAFIKDSRFGTADKAYHSDSFLLIGPGKDRKYFTDDDVKNW